MLSAFKAELELCLVLASVLIYEIYWFFYSFSDSLLNIEVAFVVQENVSMFLQCFVFVLLGSLKDNHVLQQYVCNVYSNFVCFL